jgi:hypothetical protein
MAAGTPVKRPESMPNGHGFWFKRNPRDGLRLLKHYSGPANPIRLPWQVGDDPPLGSLPKLSFRRRRVAPVHRDTHP